LKLNGTHQLLVYADDVNILGRSIRTIELNTQALIVTRQEAIADNTKYMVMSRDQNAGQNHSVKIDNSPFARVEEFRYLETNLRDQNSIQEEIKSR